MGPYYFCANILDMFEDPMLEPVMAGIDQYPDHSLITMNEWGEPINSRDDEDEVYDDCCCECDDEEDCY